MKYSTFRNLYKEVINRYLTCTFLMLFVFINNVQSNELEVVYTSPKSNSIYNSPHALIVIRFNQDISSEYFKSVGIQVVGSQNSDIDGSFILTSDPKVVLFTPLSIFSNDEVVMVKLFNKNDNKEKIYDFRFKISSNCINEVANDKNEDELSKKSSAMNIRDINLSHSADSYRLEYNLPPDFPAILIANKNKPKAGNYFLSSRFFGPPSNGTNYMFCVDTCGTPLFFRALTNRGSDFRRQPNGYLTHYPGEGGMFFQYDSSYNEMRTYAASAGYLTDMHELVISEDGSYWLFTKQLHMIDMSVIVPGGNPQATVEENIIQHLDASGNLLFQWNSLDYIPITDCNQAFVDLTGNYIDYIHVNALDFDDDGNLLLSSRHLDEITKIDANTGDIIWRWGGNNNQFTFINDDIGFYGQHSIRYHGNGVYTLFDNGNWHTPPRSRGLEYYIDENNMTATLIHEYITNDGLSFSDAMGHMQRTDDGGSLVGWAANTQGYVLTDYNPDGTKALDIMNLDTNLISYRAFKYEWETNAFQFIDDTITFEGVILPGDSVTVTGTLVNNVGEDLVISGYHTNFESFEVADDFPVLIPRFSSRDFTIVFKPEAESYYTDALTLYSDTHDDSLRIAAQTRLMGGLITSVFDDSYSDVQLKVWPNPVSSQTELRISASINIVSIKVFDVSGRVLVYQPDLECRNIIINRSSLVKGINIVEIQTNNRNIYHKKVIVK